MPNWLLAAPTLLLAVSVLSAQDTTATLRVRAVAPDSAPIAGVLVRAGRVGGQTDEQGMARLVVIPGPHLVVALRLGFAPDSAAITLRAGADTALTFVLREVTGELEGVVVHATRSGRRIEDEPVRVEVVDLEEVEEKLMMTPGDITMMLNETSGLRVQTTSPSLGGANVRVQGLRGRYTQIMSDGLPLFGAQAGGLGLLQIPPMDLGGVEVIKGVASALYGGAAMGGVINLVSRRAQDAPTREILLNQTTLGGTDLVAFVGAPIGQGDPTWSYTTLAGVHRQRQTDRDGDGWTDLPGYERAVLRPRLFWRSARGDAAMLTAGTTLEDRDGGSLEGHAAPDGLPWPERLRTERVDGGGTLSLLSGPAGVVHLRASLAAQRHRHTFGQVRERDRHFTAFSEASYTLQAGLATWVLGAAYLHESYEARDVAGFDFTRDAPGLFAQTTLNAGERLAFTLSGRLDRHVGTHVSPRASVLVRLPGEWTLRGTAGAGYFAPTPFTEETEAVGLSAIVPPSALRAERARGGSVDLGGVMGRLEVNATAFATTIGHPIGVRDAGMIEPRLELLNVPRPTRSTGGELLARWTAEPLRITATYTYVRATEADPATLERRPVPLTPRHQAGLVASWEREGAFRSGLEVYYTGRQTMPDDAYRATSRPYWHVGALVEKRFGAARVFLNAENLLNVRQTNYDPLVRPSPGPGGRWTNDVWAPLEGRVANVGVRWSLGGAA
jgi:iron complex outermembrane receptor protein